MQNWEILPPQVALILHGALVCASGSVKLVCASDEKTGNEAVLSLKLKTRTRRQSFLCPVDGEIKRK